MTRRIELNRRAVGGWIQDNGETVDAVDAYRDRRVTLPRDRAIDLLLTFDAEWPRAGHLDAVRHLIEAAR